VEGNDRLRLFCALVLPDDVVDAIAAWQERLSAPKARKMHRDELHITLAFLGSRPAAELPAIAAALDESARAAHAPRFSVRRYLETPRVGMLVLDEVRVSYGAVLAQDLQRRLEELGIYKPEFRPWKAHITVLRFRDRPRLDPELPRLEFSPSEAAAYVSVLRSAGAQYSIVHKVALGR
jgi:2'-5' RNA ligase